MQANEPDAAAYKFTIKSGGSVSQEYDIAMFENQVTPNILTNIRVVYREAETDGAWVFLTGKEIYHADNDTDGKLNATIDKIYDSISSKIRTFFRLENGDPSMPDDFVKKIEFIIREKTQWNPDTLSIVRSN